MHSCETGLKKSISPWALTFLFQHSNPQLVIDLCLEMYALIFWCFNPNCMDKGSDDCINSLWFSLVLWHVKSNSWTVMLHVDECMVFQFLSFLKCIKIGMFLMQRVDLSIWICLGMIFEFGFAFRFPCGFGIAFGFGIGIAFGFTLSVLDWLSKVVFRQ